MFKTAILYVNLEAGATFSNIIYSDPHLQVSTVFCFGGLRQLLVFLHIIIASGVATGLEYRLLSGDSRIDLISSSALNILIIGFCILLRVILTVNNTFCFATIDNVFYYVASVHSPDDGLI
jgi:hypothetical protein